MDTALHERQLARLFAASALFAWAVWTRAALEASPVLHIVVQLPALGFASWLAGSVAGQKVPALTSAHLNRHGLAGAAKSHAQLRFHTPCGPRPPGQ